VVVSALAELETSVQLRAAWLAGELRPGRYRAYLGQLAAFRAIDPFRFRSLPGSLFATALRQNREAGGSTAGRSTAFTWRRWQS
jgi:hypothetical protein